ncbi:NAD(P)-dependent dehydrogenase (short-subunit alcohol dehydrogenase family) [Paenarthrobacter nitroguajacolicus]|uniref:SDR family NAD(P)-dependent oxidoreductase n=1 Tax=Paenarthrobacter nitroguajacolicus TaxID=211146 RepID=UPI00285EBCC9|nr:SDR family oxidoreductase [Paenarthrobacter nitroguajacolicus]MDR6989186.1 NAD(P)-dependent dehydrogenase (short-subunit alcohol dehydrogenase family) [Paenarthrobacter nitroguajacolicus]
MNLTGTFLVNRAALGYMLNANGGSIVNVTSTAALIAAGPTAAYDASKSGAHGITRYLADEYADHGVRVNSVAPGWTGDTKMLRSSQRIVRPEDDQWSISMTQKHIDRMVNIPLKRPAASSEIAAAIVFLASDEASFITGTQLVVDGGSTIN